MYKYLFKYYFKYFYNSNIISLDNFRDKIINFV